MTTTTLTENFWARSQNCLTVTKTWLSPWISLHLMDFLSLTQNLNRSWTSKSLNSWTLKQGYKPRLPSVNAFQRRRYFRIIHPSVMNYVPLLIYWQCFYAWLGLRYVNHVHYFLCLGKCKFCLVLECSYVIYMCAVYFAREKTLGNRRCLFKMCLSPWFFYLSSIKRKFNVTFTHGSMIFKNIKFNSSVL